METDQKFDYRVPYSLMAALETELKCPICLEVLKNPHSTNCGHYFCKECMDNYLKEMKFKCACPLCKKPLNRRELGEDPKIKTLADMMRRIMAESTKINVGIQRTDLKKRKLDDYIKNSEEETYKVSFKSRGSEKTPLYNRAGSLEEETKQYSNAIAFSKLTAGQDSERIKRKSGGNSDFISEMIAKLDDSQDDHEHNDKTPNRFSVTSLNSALHDQSTVSKGSRIKDGNSTNNKNRDSVSKSICIVTTALPHNLQDEVQKFCKKYKAKQYKDFNENITHMVIYPSIDNRNKIQAKRTVKYVLGVIKGIWIVSFKWIIDSIIKEEVQNEEEYEATEDCYGLGAPAYARLHGGLKKLFVGCTFIISEGDKIFKPAIARSELAQIIEKAGGTVLKSLTKGQKNVLNIIIQPADSPEESSMDGGDSQRNPHSKIISHKWVLDSISNHTVLEYGSYLV